MKARIALLALVILASGLGVSLASAAPKTITVCSTDCDYSSIQKAICAASPGDTIEVQFGFYEENLIIDKDLTLKGVNKEDVILDGAAKNSPVILIRDARVTIEGLTITGGKGLWFPFTGDGIRLEGEASASIKNNIIKGNEGNGILLANSGAVEIWDNEVFANQGWGISEWTRACGFPIAAEVVPNTIEGGRNRVRDNGKGNLCGVPKELTYALLTINSSCGPINVVVNGELIPAPVGYLLFPGFWEIALSFPIDTPITLVALDMMLPSCGMLQVIVFFDHWEINGVPYYSPTVNFILDEDTIALAVYEPWPW